MQKYRMDKRNDINEFRKKRRLRRVRLNIAILVLFGLIALFIALNWGKIIAPLKDAALDVGKGGFPVDLPGSTDYVLDELGDNFCLLTDTYFYTYNSDGAMITSAQHGLQSPALSSNSRRALIYDRNGRELQLYNRSGEIFSTATEDTIDFAQVSNGERSAVVTKSSKYSNCLFVFNGEGQQIFRWASPLYLIDRVVFSQDDSSIFAAVCGADNGELEYRLLRFDLDNAEGSVWETYLGNHMVFSLEQSGKELFAVTAGGAYILDADTGGISAQTEFIKNISQIPGGELHAVMFSDSAGGKVLTVYNDTLEATAAAGLQNVTRVCAEGKNVYSLSKRTLTVFDDGLNVVSEKELQDDYSDMLVIGSSAYLLGYNTVQKVDLT